MLSGVLSGGKQCDPVVCEVRRPGSARWSYSSLRLCYNASAAWWYRYTPKARGTYYFRARYGGVAAGQAPYSRTISVAVR